MLFFLRRQTQRKRSEEQGENRRKVSRGDEIPRGPHYFPAVNFTQTVSHLTTVDWRDVSVVTSAEIRLQLNAITAP